ncbi:MAG: NADPH:quinone reductase [Lentilitoribacter sp.]
MQAIRAHQFGGSEVLQLDQMEDLVAGTGEVVVEIKAAGVNPADTYMRTGTYGIVPELPYIPGGDAGGVISQIGEGVTNFKTGDRVIVGTALSFRLQDCYATHVKRPASEVLSLPDHVSFTQAAAFGVSYPTAHMALFLRGHAKSGETIFIHGASGSVGTSAIQLAKRAGCTVIGSAGGDDGIALIKDQGVDFAVNHHSDNYIDEIKTFTEGKGVDLTLEMLANVNLDKDMDLAAKFGRIVVIGNRGDITINPRVAMMKELDIKGTALWNMTADQIKPIMEDILAGISDKSLKPIVGKEFPLSDAARAHDAVLEPGAYGKVVLIP